MGKRREDVDIFHLIILDPPSRINSNTLGVSHAIHDCTVSNTLEQINGLINTITIVLIDSFRTKLSTESFDDECL